MRVRWPSGLKVQVGEMVLIAVVVATYMLLAPATLCRSMFVLPGAYEAVVVVRAPMSVRTAARTGVPRRPRAAVGALASGAPDAWQLRMLASFLRCGAQPDRAHAGGAGVRWLDFTAPNARGKVMRSLTPDCHRRSTT